MLSEQLNNGRWERWFMHHS
jgi:hypothetical protein